MSGKLIGSLIVLVSLIFGAAVYWSQEYAYYSPVAADTAQVTLVPFATGKPEPIAVSGFEGIDGSSSPIRYRACFTTALSIPTLTETFGPYPAATPLNAPRWFGCFDAQAIGAALESGEALAFLAQRNVSDGVDRVVAVFADGRAYAWQQPNEKYQDQ